MSYAGDWNVPGLSSVPCHCGVLSGNGQINGNLVFQAGSALGAQGTGTQLASGPVLVNGTTTLQAGSRVALGGTFLPGLSYKLVNGTGAISVDPSVTVDTSQGAGLVPTLTGSLAVAGDPGLSVRLQSHFTTLALTPNQQSVAAALDAAGNSGAYGAGGSALLTNLIQNNTPGSAPAAFNSLSGEGLVGQQQAALNATDLFASTVLDVARGGLTSDAVVDAGRRRVWATGFGQSASLDSDGGKGSASWPSTLAGFAAGTDFRFDNGLRVGVAGGYSGTDYSVNDRSTNGDTKAGHAAFYGLQRLGATYLTGVFDAGFFSNSSHRLTFGTDQSSSSHSVEVLGRAEVGHAFPFTPVTVTPYAGVQIAELYNSAFNESGGTANLGVNSQSVGSQKIYLGAQVDTTRVFGGVSLTPYARLAWEHEFSMDRSINATLASLPGSSFTVYGAPAVSDAARVTTGVKLSINQSLSVYAAFDGAFSGSGNSYAGKGGIRYTW